MVKKDIPNGSIRVKLKGLVPVKKTSKGYNETDYDTNNIKKVVKIYRRHKKISFLVDKEDKTFLRGYLKPDGKVAGDRVVFLPNGNKLNKAFSLFSEHLALHEETDHHHWDVMYQNPNGDFAYLYTLDKINRSQKNKYEKVREFEEALPKLNRNLLRALRNQEWMALSMYTLIKTYMRIGNEVYFKKNKHQGLATLQKDNIVLSKNTVSFNFISKDGVPQNITLHFPDVYIKNLAKRLKKVKKNEYVFCDKNGNKLLEKDFHDAFKKYCKKEFYPHIVRSYYATKTIENFLEKNPEPSKQEIREVYNEVAEKLGHKKFSKKTHLWEPSHTVTVAHYVSPNLVKKLKKIMQKKEAKRKAKTT